MKAAKQHDIIRASEKVFYRQVLEIYATSIDYDLHADISIEFFKKVQNMIRFAIHGQTAADVIYTRADDEKESSRNEVMGSLLQVFLYNVIIC